MSWERNALLRIAPALDRMWCSMKYKRAAELALLIALVPTGAPVLAHHGAVGYDYTVPRKTLKGTVEQFSWQNPHTLLLLDVKDDKGNVVVWTMELNNPGNLVELGWNHNSLNPGVEVTVTFNPAKSKPNGICADVLLSDGRKLHSSQGCVGGDLKSFDELRQLNT
jgi:hypothetical protein